MLPWFVNTVQDNFKLPTNTLPEWARPSDITRIFGIKRGTLWALMSSGDIRSVSLRKKHQLKGTRLVNVQSVRDFIEAQTPGTEKRSEGL